MVGANGRDRIAGGRSGAFGRSIQNSGEQIPSRVVGTFRPGNIFVGGGGR
jgi:hypothetical protein